MPFEIDPHQALKDERGRELLKLLNQQKTDSAVVILGAGMLEDDLETLIRNCCVRDTNSIKKVVDPLFDVYAPLSTFSAKVNICYALGLISKKTHRTVDLVRKL